MEAFDVFNAAIEAFAPSVLNGVNPLEDGTIVSRQSTGETFFQYRVVQKSKI